MAEADAGRRKKMKMPRVPGRTTPAFAFSVLDRSLKECLGNRAFAKEDASKALAYLFGENEPECINCGRREIKRWDHIVPVKHCGETVLGNMIPACTECDDSKRDLTFDDWMKSETRLSPQTRGVTDISARTITIREYVAHFGYKVRTLEERLTEDENAVLHRINKLRDELKREIETPISQYQARMASTR
ncbi:MAG: HNH endonuclease signature motif containing protein [bacterium]